MSEQTIIKLPDGNMMPQLGLGVVWQASSDDALKAVMKAFEVGYRAVDTAAIYKNEESVGQAISQSALPREQIFITTKLWNDDQLNVRAALETSLEKLRLDSVNLYLMHWPCPEKDNYVDAWKQIILLQQQGMATSIGVCNFNESHLKRLIDETGVTPAVNQIELHPLFQQRTLYAWNAMHQIQTESWSPLAQGGKGVFDHPVIKGLAKQYGKTPAQIVIRWHLDCGLVVIPKSVTPSRIEENFNVFDFRLDKDDISEITKLDAGHRLGPDPELSNF